MKQLTTLLDYLSAKGFVVDKTHLSAMQTPDNVAWYLQLLLAIGVSVAFALFASLLMLLEFDKLSALEQSCIGLGFIAIAIFLYRQVIATAKHHATIGATLATQISFVLMISGKGLLFYHICDYFAWQDVGLYALVAAVLTAATTPFYGVKMEQILSLAVVVFLLLFIANTSDFAPMIHSLILGLSLLCMVYYASSLKWRRYRHWYLSFLLAIFLRLTLPSDTLAYLGIEGYLYYPSFVFAVVLSLFTIHLGAKHGADYRLSLLIIAIIILAYFLPATIFFALLLMALGHAQHDKWLLTIGTILLPCYLSQYYYQLNINLLSKSYLLVASGAVLLLSAAVIAKMGWHRVEAEQ